jgi:hypothetical protein
LAEPDSALELCAGKLALEERLGLDSGLPLQAAAQQATPTQHLNFVLSFMTILLGSMSD